MALALQHVQSQRQSISPAMWLGLNLLSLPVGELRDEIRREIDSNPALEAVGTGPLPGNLSSGAEGFDFENVAAESGESLGEHLLAELRLSGVTGREAEICRQIIAEIDGDGRFTGSVPDLQMVSGATTDEIEAARQRVMTFDPRGCGAKDLRECLLAQVETLPSARRDEARDGIAALVRLMADPAAARAGAALAPATLRLLKQLDPYPGRQYDFRKADIVTPDVRVDEDGEIEMDTRDIPELRVSPKYVMMARDASLDEETRRFAAERVRRAREFREAVVRRLETMEKVTQAAIGGQGAYLRAGPSALRRQTMSDVARAAKCSVSTVSRAAARKYVKTPRGIVPLRKFFSLVDRAPIERLAGLLRDPATAHLSDRVLSERLAAEGYAMARRTVAKYRRRLASGFEVSGKNQEKRRKGPNETDE